jgi:hypothetical protein
MFTEINAITKPHPHDPHARIREIGYMVGSTVMYRYSLDQAIAMDQRGDTKFYVAAGGHRVLIDAVPASLTHNAFMRTRNDNFTPDNMLSLQQLLSQNRLLAEMLYGGGVK